MGGCGSTGWPAPPSAGPCPDRTSAMLLLLPTPPFFTGVTKGERRTEKRGLSPPYLFRLRDSRLDVERGFLGHQWNTAGHVQYLACHEIGKLRCEKEGSPCDVLRGSHASRGTSLFARAAKKVSRWGPFGIKLSQKGVSMGPGTMAFT